MLAWILSPIMIRWLISENIWICVIKLVLNHLYIRIIGKRYKNMFPCTSSRVNASMSELVHGIMPYFETWSYTSHRLMFFVVNTTENKAYLILSYLKPTPLDHSRSFSPLTAVASVLTTRPLHIRRNGWAPTIQNRLGQEISPPGYLHLTLAYIYFWMRHKKMSPYQW